MFGKLDKEGAALASLVLADLRTATGKLSAAATRLNLEWVEQHLDPATFEEVRRTVERRLGRDIFDHPRGRWTPYGDHLVLLDALSEHLDAEELRRMGAHGADQVHRVVPGAGTVLRFAGPQRLLRRADWIWRTYADFGELQVLDASQDGGQLALAGFEATEPFCTSLGGFLEGLLQRVTGGEAQVEHPECMARGDAQCRFQGAWS